MQFDYLYTPRLALRKMTSDTIAQVLSKCSKDEAMTLLGATTEQEYQKYVERSHLGYDSFYRRVLHFQLLIKDTDLVIGQCGYHSWAFEHNRAELFYYLANDEHKRQGYMTETLPTILSYGFEHMDLFRIEAVIDLANTPSLKLLEHNGFKQEAVLRKHYKVENDLHDSHLFVLLKSDVQT
jgi:[ribosomal protein S5]-alanine N-acetyltransferase